MLWHRKKGPTRGGSGDKGLLQGTAQALIRLGMLGIEREHPAVQKGVDFLFEQQNEDGSWSLASDLEHGERYGNYDMIPLQTAMPLRGVAVAGESVTDEDRIARAVAEIKAELEEQLELSLEIIWINRQRK